MNDAGIIDLYWQRSERAIPETENAYGPYCHTVAYNLLRNAEDAEESVNDTWLAAWNAMPPERPNSLKAFLGRITRNISVTRLRRSGSQKRGGGEVSLALDELRECAGGDTAEEAFEAAELGRLIDRFLRGLSASECNLFLRRYWYLDSIDMLAARYGLRPGAVKTRLHRTREKLRTFLRKEGYAL